MTLFQHVYFTLVSQQSLHVDKSFVVIYIDMMFSRGTIEQTPYAMIQDYQHNNIQRLLVTAPLGLTQSYLHKLFNLIPGLEYCDLNEQTGLLKIETFYCL